jgi:hypothetical protein
MTDSWLPGEVEDPGISALPRGAFLLLQISFGLVLVLARRIGEEMLIAGTLRSQIENRCLQVLHL